MSILEILGANSCCIYFRKTALKMRLNETVPVTLFYFFFLIREVNIFGAF